ncbi:YtpI family protein [Salirhabdus salicampi]|uniref:YtpI family protein n=1 Tax=Salirhabdus salicampi TaxID=476102 RepID=UPI0020C4E9CC|nr:YtpI family protein [Salirhabdus salicampi]MCP8617110.1 YtpI family protein [Salirhabdus salicampi]
MFIFVLIVVLSIVMYIFFKVKILTLKDQLMMHYTNAKARIALGMFIFFFAMNQYLFYQTKLSLYIGIVFLFLGAIQIHYGYKLFSFYRNEIVQQMKQEE